MSMRKRAAFVCIGTALGDYRGRRFEQQLEALASWRHTAELVKIIAFHWPRGREGEFHSAGVEFYGDIPTYGDRGRYQEIGPMFQHLEQIANGGLCIFVNSDIVLRPSLIGALSAIDISGSWLAVGRRWRVPEGVSVGGELEEFCDVYTRDSKNLGDAGAIDFFAFRSLHHLRVLPVFVGIAGWDNLLIYSARRSRWRVIDTTPWRGVLHLEHPARLNGQGAREAYESEEAQYHAGLSSNRKKLFTVDSSTDVLTPTGRRGACMVPRMAQRRWLDWAIIRDLSGIILLALRAVAWLHKQLIRLVGSGWACRHDLEWYV